MNANLRNMIAVLPLLAWAMPAMAAQPLVLDTESMDRVTAGSRPLFERIASVLDALPHSADDSDAPLFQRLNAEQLALLTRTLEGERTAFRQTRSGELAASHQLASGEKLVIVKEIASSPVTAAPSVARQIEQIPVGLVNSGEPVNVRQTSANGFNYLYIRSTGNSAITVTQRNGF